MVCKIKWVIVLAVSMIMSCMGRSGDSLLGESALSNDGVAEFDLVPKMVKKGNVVPVEVYLTPINLDQFLSERNYLEQLEEKGQLLKGYEFDLIFDWGGIIRREVVKNQSGFLRPNSILIDSYVFENKIANSQGKFTVIVRHIDETLEHRVGPFKVEVRFYSGK